MPKIATRVKSNLPDFRGAAHLYHLSERIDFERLNDTNTGFTKETTNHVIVSAVPDVLIDDTPETMAFPADSEGNVLSYSDVMMARYYNPDQLLVDNGWAVVMGEEA